ncbi:MAG TPA: ABC transporter substrate-binding protein [Syntrophomonadaceae bacterium]|nr:ABC transporter substrate-binding protein [Syntrophomonadaceae bacterium]
MKKILALVLGLLLLFSVVGCKVSESSDNSMIKIGIVQIVEHPSLNTIREAFIDELAENGFKDGENIIIDYQSAQNDQTNLKTICQKFSNNKYDLIVAIATPTAQAAVGETKDIPIVFSACTDPIAAELLTDLDNPGGNVTGTSDKVAVAKIMELAKEITPEIKTIGALYTASETNSISVIEDLKEYADKNGLTIVEATVTNSSEVQQATLSLINKVDAIFSPIDNTVASAMPIVTQVAIEAKIPVYVAADSLVADGGLATYGINYITLGKETAKMAAEILNGKNPGDIPVKTITDIDIYLNQTTADAIGLTFPQDILDKAKEVF